jgi:hypothetical protein
VRAIVTAGKKTGTYWGRVARRARGRLHIRTGNGPVKDSHHRFSMSVPRADGYGYAWIPLTIQEGGNGAPPRLEDSDSGAMNI